MKLLSNLKIICILVALKILFFSWTVYALDETASVNMNIPSISRLVITGSDQTIDLLQDASGEAAYEAGYIDGEINKPTLIVDSNTTWTLSVKVSSDWNMVGRYQKATQDLQFKVSSTTGRQTGFSGFTPLSLTEQEIATYAGGVGDDMYYGQYRILLDWEKDIPGSYAIIIVYTLVTQPL